MNKEYLTVKEFAEAAKISQQAVYKQISSRLKPFVITKGNQKMIAAAALKEFYFPDDSTQVEQVDQLDSTPKNQEFQPVVEQVDQPDSTRNSEDKQQQILEDQIKELQEQIKEILKNEQEEKQFLRDQIKQKDKQIESLTDNLKIAQQLAAADKKKLLELEAKTQEIITEEDRSSPAAAAADQDPAKDQNDLQQRRGFFARIFARKNKEKR